MEIKFFESLTRLGSILRQVLWLIFSYGGIFMVVPLFFEVTASLCDFRGSHAESRIPRQLRGSLWANSAAWLAIPRESRCLRGIRAARGIPCEPRGGTKVAVVDSAFAKFSAVFEEPRDVRAGSEWSQLLRSPRIARDFR